MVSDQCIDSLTEREQPIDQLILRQLIKCYGEQLQQEDKGGTKTGGTDGAAPDVSEHHTGFTG